MCDTMIVGCRDNAANRDSPSRFVLAAFASLAAARAAVRDLGAIAGDQGRSFMVVDGAGHDSAAAGPNGQPAIRVLAVDGVGEAATISNDAGDWALAMLRDGMSGVKQREGSTTPQMPARFSDTLARLIEDGGALLFVCVDGPEQQRRAARALLDCHCELLLTHEAIVRHF